MQHTTKTQQETLELGKTIATKLKGGDIVLLKGELGTGKTVLTKGIAQGLGIKDNITSPTFTLMNIYPIPNSKFQIPNLVHVDTYRLENEDQLIEIGIEDYIGNANSICVIEWPEKIKALLNNKKTITIAIEHIDENEREIMISDK